MCALICTLAEYGNGSTDGHDKITLKVEVESPLQISRSPIIIPLPGGSIIGLDLGRNAASISLSGVVDYALTELFVDTLGGSGNFTAGHTLTGTAGWDSLTSPVRGATPTATIVAGYPDLTTPTSLIVSGVTQFFVDNEPVSDGTRTAKVNCPFPTKTRLEHVARYWYSSGLMTLTTRSGSYTVLLTGEDFTMQAGIEDRYAFKMSFAQAYQDLT
jgi:hypothetical protein